jgi:hypothetical protein
MSRGFSPLERRVLVELVSVIRDREGGDDWDYISLSVPLRTLYERLYIPGDRPHDVERRNQRQAQRRAMKRLFDDGLIEAVALAWVDVRAEQIIEWQGGGRRKQYKNIHVGTPRWVEVSLTDTGIAAATALEAEAA